MGVMAAVFPISSDVTQCHAFHPIAISIHIFLLSIGLSSLTRTMVSHA